MLFDTQRAGSQALWPSSGIFLGDLDASRRVWAGCELCYSHTIGSFFHAVSCHYLPPQEGPHSIWAAHQLPNPGLAILQHRAPGKGSGAPDQVRTKFMKLTALLMLRTNMG